MSAITTDTFADLLKQLGDIPASRILMCPSPGTATEKDVIQVEARTNRLCELIDGVLVEKPMGWFESRLAVVLAYYLEAFLEKRDLGFVIGEAGMLRVVHGQVRLPDVSFFSWKHFPNRRLPLGAILDRTPDLAVEILSEGNTPKEMARKRREYFAGGTKLVWQVDPELRTVAVYTSPRKFTVLHENDTLEGGRVLPGFDLSIKQWFTRAGRRGS
jgi:Uma2 family endonuclease